MGCVESAAEPPPQRHRSSVKQPIRNGSSQKRPSKSAPQNGSTKRSTARGQNGTAAPKKITIDVGIQTEGNSFILRRLSSRIKQKKSTKEQRLVEPPDESLLFDLNRSVALNHSAVAQYIEQALTLQDKEEPVRRVSSKKPEVNTDDVPADEGPVSKKDQRLVQECWKVMQNDLISFGVEFFVRVVEHNPTLSQVFSFGKLNLSTEELHHNADLRAHGQRVMETIGAAVDGLEDLELIVAILEDLGARHKMYGAKPEHFTAIREAFMYSLKNGLPPKVFTSEVQEAWETILTVVAETMSSTMGNEYDDLEADEILENQAVESDEGPVSNSDKRLVRDCWKVIQRDLVNIGAKFFVRLLEKNPSIRNLFPFGKSSLPPQMLKRDPDLRAHGQRVMETIGVAVDGLDDLDVVVTILQDLGARHNMYGAKPEHFQPVVEALMFSLKTSLPEDVFTSEVQEAWIHILKMVAATMSSTLK